MGTKQVCGAWMPNAKERCARGAGHRWHHWTLASVEANREANRLYDATPERREANRRRDATPERREARRRRDATPERREASRRGGYLRRYGITTEDKAAILDSQGGCCAICRRTAPNGHGWHTDHYDDEDGRPVVRGVLCHSCNIAVGHMGESPTVAGRAQAYLLAHQPKEAV